MKKLVPIISILIIFMACTPKAQQVREVLLVANTQSQLGEGALWDYQNDRLLWINIQKQLLHAYYPATQQNDSFLLPSKVGTVVPINSNEVLVALEDGVYLYNLKTDKVALKSNYEPDKETNRSNDGKCDPAGRFWIGTMSTNGSQKAGGLYMINHDYSSTKKIDSVSISNGIVWSADKTKMYYIDTPTHKVMQYDYNNANGVISNPKIAIEIPDSLGYPDGCTIDENGNIWIGMWGGSAVTCWNPNTGELVDQIEVPAKNVTSCAFGGKNLDELYITTARQNTNKEELEAYPNAGGLFMVKPGIKGVKAFYFREQNND